MSIVISLRTSDNQNVATRLIQNLSERFSDRFVGIESIEWDVVEESHGFEATCRVHSQSGYYRASALSPSLESAIKQTSSKLIRQRRRRKSQSIHSRQDRLSSPMMKQGTSSIASELPIASADLQN